MIGLAVALVVVVAVAVSIAIAKFANHPEQAASHEEPDTTTTSERFYETADRPAGPDADDLVTPDLQAEPDSGIRSAAAPEEEQRRGPA